MTAIRRPDFADTALLAQPPKRRQPDPLDWHERAERADWTLLRLVLCAATATFVIALASSLPL